MFYCDRKGNVNPMVNNDNYLKICLVIAYVY